MILDDPQSHFIFVYHPGIFKGKKYTVRNGRVLTNGEILNFWGKWLVLGDKPRLDDLARKLDPFVEDETIPCIKYDRLPSVNLGIEECVMCVYCDARDRDKVWQVLSQFGVELKAWVKEKETMAMWMPGGRLLERWLASKNFDEATKSAVRQDSKARFEYIFENPDEEFAPWAQ